MDDEVGPGIPRTLGAIIAAMHAAVDEMGDRETFRGYGPEQGYEILREALLETQVCDVGVLVPRRNEHERRGVECRDLCFGQAPGDCCGGVAGAATEIDHRPGVRRHERADLVAQA